MAIDRSKLQRMYKLMADNGYTQDYNTFEKKFTGDSNYANRKAVYDLFTKNGADLGGSYEEFMRKLQKPVVREKRKVKSEKSNGSALGRAQEMVAQQKWGGYGGAVAPMQNDSELVRGLKNADAAQRLQAPVNYAKSGAVKQMVKQTRERQHVVGQNVEQAGRQFTNRERDRRNAPAFDLGNEDVNNNIVKTRGQLEDDIEKSAAKFVNDEFGNYIGEVFKKEEDAAFERGQNAAENIIAASPTSAVFSATRARNEEMSPEKRLANITKEVENNIQTLFSSPNVAKRINTEAAKLGITPEAYVQNTLIPNLMNKVASDFDKTELKNLLPKGATETILMHAQNSMNGALASIGLMTRGQRQYGQRALAETLEGNNPDYKPGLGTRVAGSTYSFMMDSTPIGLMGKAGATVAGKILGNGVAQMARVANSSLGGRIARMVGSGMVSQGVTGVLYGSTNAAVQNYSTGDDTSIGNTVKLMTMGGVSEGASWATMGGIGGAVGGSLYNMSGLKRIPAKVFQIAMEGVGMHMGGNVAKMIEGHDTDWLSVEGNLEACANVVALKLTHARLPKRYAKDGKKESYLGMVARNLYNLTVSDGQRAALGGYTFINEEKEQLFGSANAPRRKEYIYGYDKYDVPLTRSENLVDWALRTKKTTARGKGEESYKGTDAEFVKTAYDEIMADNTIPWDTKAKFSALVMGTVPSARPMMDHIAIERDERGAYVGEYSLYGELLSKNRYKTADEYVSIKYNLGAKKENQRLSNAYGAAQIKDEKAAQETLETVAETFGFTAEQLKAAMDKDPLKRSEEEQNACVALRKTYEGEQFPEGTLHPDQSQTEGKDVVEENNLGTENPNNEAVAEVLNNMNNAEKAFNAALESNDVLKQEYERLTKEGLSEPQIYMELFNSGLTQEQLAPFADYINAKAKAVGMYRGTEQKIAETVQKHVEQWSYKGELNGEKQEGGQMVFVKDNNGRLLIVGAGDVAFDNDGRARESVGDMLSVLDAEKGEMDFVSVKDVKLERTVASEEYAKEYQELLEVKNSEVYAQNEQQKQMENAAGGVAPEGGKPEKPITEQGNAETTVQTGEANKPVPTFADGSPVPMTKDSKGRETADYSMMTPEQGAEWIEKTFGEDAEAVADGKIERAKKDLSKAEKMDIDMTADDADVLEAKTKKKAAIEAAQKELELYTNIKKAMVEKKVKATMEAETKPSEGDVSLSKPREKFESGTRIVGNKRTRTLPDGSKIKGHYELVEADSLTPSHNANDGYKKSEGFPVNEEGRTINDRDYENDKDAQRVTDMIAKNYDGQAVDQVPVVTKDGIVVDGNGRTMAGQKAAKDGTDGAYIEALKENAENYGFTAEQIEQSGMEHPRLVLVSDEPLPYDTATFAKFNKNEKKTQGNTQQTVAISKKLGGDEISAIAAEIEGSGSLDAFFNNPTAINSLLKRLIDKGVIGLNEVAGLREGENKLSASGKDFVRNLLLGSVFSEDTIRMMGADAGLKSKALNGIRAVLDNMKLGDYALRGEIDKAVQLVYEARQQGGDVDAYLRTPAMFGENAADRYDPVSQAIALALDGKAEDFRDLMMAYNRNAAHYADANQLDVFGDRPTKEEFINEFLKLRNWKNYETRRSENEGNGDVGGTQGSEPETSGGNEQTEGNGEGVTPTGAGAGSSMDPDGFDRAVEQLKTAKGEERERILDQMEEYVNEFAESNGYDKPVVLRTKKDLADAAKDPDDKFAIENMPDDAHNPGYYEDGEIHIYLEGSRGSKELRETFEHESVHADNDADPSRVEMLISSVNETGEITFEELEKVVETLSNSDRYSYLAEKLDYNDGLRMLADETLAHLVAHAYKNGIDAMSDITKNPTLLYIAKKSFKFRENERQRQERESISGSTEQQRKKVDVQPTQEHSGTVGENNEGKSGVVTDASIGTGIRDNEGEGETINDRRRKEGLAKSGDKTLERKNLDDVSTEENGGALEGDKEGKPENDNGGSPDRDIQAGEEQREVEEKAIFEQRKAAYLKALKEGKTGKELENAKLHYKFSFLDYQNVMGVTDAESLEKLWKRELESAKAPEPPKTNPLAWLAHTAEMFKDEQIQKAREELTAAKESGDASDIKRATEKMKQAMETKLRGNGIGLVERRRIIGRELGKILGKEAGKAEAEKVNKPWEQMDLEEREAVSSKNPLTETDINELTSEENRELIPAALAYLRGDKGNIINAISYFKIWNDVRSRHENVPDNSGTKDGTQLDAPNTGGSQELGLGRGREGGGPDGPVDRTDGERTTPGERESGTGGENDTPVSTGKPRVDKGEGNTPGMDAVSAGSTDTRGGGGAGNEGNVPKRGGQGGGNGPLDPNAGRKPAAKQGTHFPDSTSERLKQERAEYEQKKKDFWERWKKAGQGYVKIALTPFKKLNLSPEQIEMLPELFKMHLNGAVLKIKEGIYKFNEWKAAMRAEEGEELKMIGLSDDDVDRFIEDYWNTPYQMDGETLTIGEWAGIHGNEELRNKLSEPLNDKYQRQMDAEPIKVKIGDKKNIEETLPYLLPQQQEDVLKAETQFFGNEHADREHAYGKGYMFTNGTGTGKTFTGLGIAKRLVKQGKGRILIVTPSQKKVSDWIKDGRNLNMEIRDLDSIAKERGTTATTESGEGVVITTFANFGVNKKLLEENWDAVIYDESHRIMENKKGAETARSMQHYMVTNRDERHCFLRLQETNKDYQKMKSLGEQFDAERDKEVKRIQDEYKASHPSATPRDVAYATSRMLPKEIQNFTPGDYASFPKLGKIHGEYMKAFSHYVNDVKPKLEAQAKNEWKDTKTIFLSATPFNTRENLDYVEGYIFKYPETDERGMSGRTQFYLNNFGAAYKFRYNRLEQSTSNHEAVAKQEIAFSDYLQDTLGTMSGRIIDCPYDYSRDFPTVSPDHAEQFNQAVQDAIRGHGVLADAYRRTIGDYNYGSALFETMKVANIIERIKAHLDAGRKVVVFHRRVETKEPLKPPFALMLEQANHLVSIMGEGEDKKEAAQAVRDFRKKYADLLKWEQTLDYSMPREQIAKVFGKDNVLFFSGKESPKVKNKAVDIFNDDNSGKNIIVIQEASGKEGISLHDKTGEHQRVCITLALPQSPITALQIEGRTYRIGNKSNAIFEYPILGLNSEMMLFGEKFNNQVSTTENLALGSKARSLRDSFAKGILEHSGIVPIEQQGVGGKEFDAPKEQNADPYDDAVLDYYSNQKLNSRNREGVDYFPTPEPLGYKMVEWANMGEGDTAMEPSAGHGAIARYVPKGNQMTAIEPSQSLFTKLQLKAGGLGRKFVNTIFENYDLKNKHDVVVMNPPFGTAGATAIAHLGKAFKHLEEGGRVVALIPRGSTDKKFDKWIEGEKTAVLRAEVELPDIVFEQAGTKVICRVVVVDKISNEAMRAKAGRVEKWNLGEHYDKIEDFFEDLRDVKMPDRIIDTNAIMMKKSKQTVKDLKELKGVTVDFNEGGIDVNVRGDWKDYFVPFFDEGYTAEQKKKTLASQYETLEQQERQTRNETSQAVIAELKKLTCKLAGMTEEEMQRYLKKKYEGKGVMYRVEHAAEVYNKAKGGSKGQRDGRVVPEDVDKKTSEGIEKKFDEEIGDIEKRISESQRKLFEEQVANNFEDFSKMSRNEILNDLYGKELDVRRLERSGEAGDTGDYLSNERIRYECAKAAARRELEYRDVRRRAIEDTYGLRPGTSLTFEDIERTFRRNNREAEKEQLFEQAVSVVKKLGIDFGVGDEGPNGSSGVATTDREIALFVDGLTKTATRHKDDISNTILHEMLHQATMGAIHLVNSGKAEGVLTQKQIDAVNTIIDIYHKVKDDVKRFEEDTYGLQNEYEFAAQMGNSVQRKALDMFETIKAAFRKKGDSDSRNLWQRFKDAMKTLIFGNSDKSKMDKAIEDIIGDFNENVHEMAMDDVRRNDWSMSTATPKGGVSERIIKTVEKVAKRTGGKVKMVNSVEEIENPKVRKDIENGKQVTGWYDEKTGEVHLYMPNIHDTYTAEKTVWHETVGHKGMRGLLGDKFDSYMRDLWMDLDNPINAELRAYVKEKMNMNHLGFYDAIEEFIAKSAEDGKGEPGFWNYIKNKVTDALHEIGYRVSPNVKDVKYMLWLAKNVQKHGDSPLWKMRAEAVRWKIEHEKTEYTKIEGGELYDNDGKSHDFENMSREEWLEATDGEIHYRTAPSAATALDRYHHALDRHSYMATEAFMDNMLSLKKLMEAIDPSIRKIEDVASSMNPYLMQNIMEGKMSDKSKLFEIRYMDPLSKAMSSVLDSFDGKKVEDRIRNFNLYMIRKHGLERNRVLFVRDWIKSEKRKGKSEESDSIDALESAWKGEKYDLRKKLDSGQIDLKEYYRQMDEWIVTNLDKDFKAEEHDYSGMHGLQGIADKKAAYDDAGAIDEVMSQEASMESMKKGSVADFWKKVKAATDYSVNSDYESGLISQITHDGVLGMFDWYVPLRKFDEATAEDVYGYVTEMGDPSNYIGTTLMNAKGRKSLSNVEILAQIGLMGNRAIRNGGQNTIKQAFARFVRNSGEQNLVKETKVWVEKIGTDRNGNDIWEEAYPQIPEGASADDVASIVDAFETDMRAKQAKGETKSLSNSTDIGFKFQRAKDKSQHFVDVKIAGRTHRFVVLGNPRAAQALNGMLENGKASRKWLQTVTRWMAMASTSWSPEFVMRNIVRDAEFASSHVRAKEGGRYAKKWARYYGELNPLNVFYNEGAGRLKSMKMKDFKNGVGFGLYARYREGTLGNSKMERYFKEFMENGGETGFVQLFSMHDMEKSYKSIVEKESAKGAKKVMVNAVEVLKNLGKNVESLNEVAENMARFATYCTSRDLGRSAARSAYDAKEVSTNFNRHGSGDEIKSFKNGEMSGWQKTRRNTYGFVAGYLRNYSMFFNAGIQSTNLLFKNFKRAPVGTAVAMTSAPFALALIMAAVNNAIIQNEDKKDRGNVKDPYGELPDYIRRNNWCIYVGKNRFVTVPLAIELRAFYSLGDLAAGQTFAKNVKSQRNWAMDAVGCMSQLFPVTDFLNNPNFEKSVTNGLSMFGEAVAPTAFVPFIEWLLNNDWKGAPIRRTGDKTELNPAWQNAYNNVPARLVDLNKWVNAKTNNIAPGNPEMKGNDALDWITDPSMLNHFYSSWSGGMGTFVQRTAGLGAKATTGKADEIEVGDVPFLRSLFYTPREQSSMARTKAKWYNYKEEMEQTIANNDKLKSKNVPTMKRIENAAALDKFEGSPEQRKVNIIKNAEKRMRHWNTMRKKWADDKKQVDFANHNIEMIMQEAVEDLDRIE